MSDAVVIGAGVMGASVAYRLAKAGVRVTVLESTLVGGGTSGCSFAWLNAGNKPPKAYHDLNVAGMRAHAQLTDDFGSTPWLHGGGHVEWYITEAAQRTQRTKIEQLRAWDYPVEWITSADLTELEPDLNRAAIGDAPIAYFPREGWVEAVPYAQAMLSAAVRLGAVLLTGARVESVQTSGGRATGVTIRGGERVPADVVVNCAGRWSDHVAALAGASMPLKPTHGMLVYTPPVGTNLQRILRGPGIHVRPDGGGRLVLHSGDADQAIANGAEPSTSLPVVYDLVRRLAEILPCTRGTHAEAVRTAVRPIPADGLSTVGPAPGLDGYYVVVTHSAVTLSPYLSLLAAEEIAHGRTVPELEPFRPSRFLALQPAAPTPA
jgi:glycine/D-amino acid oxidase-like deaminating enzyme